MSTPAAYVVDPADPRAPPQAVWDGLTEHQRARVVASLPSEIARAVPEGDEHRVPKERARQALDEHFRRIKKRVYVSAELPVYYPDEPMFAPDLIAVVDTSVEPRASWIVSKEQRGLDFVLEIHVAGEARKDFASNVERFARLGIPEHFAYDVRRRRLCGWRLPLTAARKYETLLPQAGRWPSAVLGLDLAVDELGLRFFHGFAPILDARELIEKLSGMVDDAILRAEAEAQRAERLAARLRALGVDPDAEDITR